MSTHKKPIARVGTPIVMMANQTTWPYRGNVVVMDLTGKRYSHEVHNEVPERVKRLKFNRHDAR